MMPSDPRGLDPSTEHVGKGIDELSEGRVDPRGIDERGHQVGVGFGGLGADAGEGRLDRGRVALSPHLVEPAPLFLLDLGTDAQYRRRWFVAALEESVDA